MAAELFPGAIRAQEDVMRKLDRRLLGGIIGSAAAVLLLMAPVASASSSGLPQATTTNNSISGNWAGYVAAPGGGVTSVTGSWTVPVAGTLPPGVSSTWVGIGGFNTSDLIQAGTQQISAPLDSFIAGGAYAAWYELLPAAPVYFTGCSPDPACTVSPGDAMSVTISGGGSQWTVSVSDGGRWTYSTSLRYASSQSSAEWIHESPSLAGAVIVPVGNSGVVKFAGTNSATIAGASRNIGGSNATATDALPVETTTSALNSAGNAFNVCTYAVTCSAPPG